MRKCTGQRCTRVIEISLLRLLNYRVMESSESEEVLVDNISNVTGREAATAEGIAITYGSLFVMALLPLYTGSIRSVAYHLGLKVVCKLISSSYLSFFLLDTWGRSR